MRKIIEGIKGYLLCFILLIPFGLFLAEKVVKPIEQNLVSSICSDKLVLDKNNHFYFNFLPDGTISNIKTKDTSSFLYEYPETEIYVGFKINGNHIERKNVCFKREGNKEFTANVKVSNVDRFGKWIDNNYKITMTYEVLGYETRLNYKCIEILADKSEKSADLSTTILLQFKSDISNLKINNADIVTFDGQSYKHFVPSNTSIPKKDSSKFGFGFKQNKHFIYLLINGWDNIINATNGKICQLYAEDIKGFSTISLIGGQLDLNFLKDYKLTQLFDGGFFSFININLVKFIEYINSKTGNVFITGTIFVFIVYFTQLLISIKFIKNFIKRHHIEREIDNLGQDVKQDKKDITKIHMLQQNDINYFTSSGQLIIAYQFIFSTVIKKAIDSSYLFNGIKFLWIKNIALPEPYSLFNLYGYLSTNFFPSMGIFCILFSLMTQIVFLSLYKEESKEIISSIFVIIAFAWWMSNYNVASYIFIGLYYILIYLTNRIIFSK
jgi:hypothetical protein